MGDQIKKYPEGLLVQKNLFRPKLDTSTGRPVTVGFTTPDNQFFPFEDGEELVIERSLNGKVEEVKIRIVDEKGEPRDIPVQEWINLYQGQELN